MSLQGLFVTFEGVECSGKSTQAALLADALGRAGHSVLLLREPGSTALGEKIRALLHHDSDAHCLFPETELLLFAASRAQLCREKITPALQNGTHVICDRFIDSSVVYQGYARGIPTSTVEWINRFATANLDPHITFILDLDVEKVFLRLKQRNIPLDRIESLGRDFHEKVRSAYLQLAKATPHRCILLDASLPQQIIAEQIRTHINHLRHGILP